MFTMADEQTAGMPAEDTAGAQQNPPAEGSATKTFTQEELDSLRERIQELEGEKSTADAELAALKAASQQADWRAKASAETGVPADILRGDTEEEVMAHAKSIQALMPKAPVFRDSGKPAPEVGNGPLASFSKFMDENFN